LLHIFRTSSSNASLSFFAVALVISPIGTSRPLAWLRLVLGWSSSEVEVYPHKKDVIWPNKPERTSITRTNM
jgi:hypothetical protein